MGLKLLDRILFGNTEELCDSSRAQQVSAYEQLELMPSREEQSRARALWDMRKACTANRYAATCDSKLEGHVGTDSKLEGQVDGFRNNSNTI